MQGKADHNGHPLACNVEQLWDTTIKSGLLIMYLYFIAWALFVELFIGQYTTFCVPPNYYCVKIHNFQNEMKL